MIQIEKERTQKRIDWNAIRAEYIGGGTSYRKLAEKYGVSLTVLKTRAKRENWVSLAEGARHKADTKATQKTASVAADNAVIAARIKSKLLQKMERIIDSLAEETDATETREQTFDDGGSYTKIRRLRDLTSSYKDLTADLPRAEEENRNAPVIELLKKLDRECGVKEET